MATESIIINTIIIAKPSKGLQSHFASPTIQNINVKMSGESETTISIQPGINKQHWRETAFLCSLTGLTCGDRGSLFTSVNITEAKQTAIVSVENSVLEAAQQEQTGPPLSRLCCGSSHMQTKQAAADFGVDKANIILRLCYNHHHATVSG